MSAFSGSRFANPNRTDVLSLGPCKCPGTPHEEDTVVHRLELGSGEEERAGTFGWSVTGWQYFDSAAARAKLIEIGVVRWNLLGPDGEEMPVNARSASLLDDETLRLISERLDEVTASKEPPLPKASDAPSAAISRGNGSRVRTTRKGG